MEDVRLQKITALRQAGRVPYAAKFARTHTLAAAAKFKPGKRKLSIAGRIMLWREMGKMTFATLQDESGRLQIAFKEDILGTEEYDRIRKTADLGDFLGITGERFDTQKGEPTVLARSWTMLTKSLRPPPEKWQGIANQETAWRQRYLDLMSNRETFERFQLRSRFLRLLRQFYWDHGFTEVETPVLVNAASGAIAKPFRTHHEAYDLDMFLRIAPETFLKECLIGGFDRVFEVARCFRNEGLDPSHLQDFTMAEHYAAYWDYEENMRFTEEMLSTILRELKGTTTVVIPDREGKLVEVDFSPPWPRVSVRDAIRTACGIDVTEAPDADSLRSAMGKAKIRLDVPVEKLGRGNLIDQLYKKVSRPRIVQPTFLTQHPVDLSPLARLSDDDPTITDRFQLVVGGWEIVNAYSELIDPVDQAKRFEQQAAVKRGGDTEAHGKDDEYVKALEYGCPPCSGWGMGIDRIVALLTQQGNLRDVVLFPLMKPVENMEKARKGENVQNAQKPGQTEVLPPPSHLLQHAEYGHLLPAAHALLTQHVDKTREHLLATGAVMEALAQRFGGDPQTWKVAGMLHDLDWDHLEKDIEAHCGTTLEELLKPLRAPQELLEDIRSHYAEKYGGAHPLDSMLRRCLYCADELTGFIIAVALVRPNKKLADTEVKSVKKKLKEKGFAAQVKREQILQCEPLLGIPLDEFIAITLQAMQKIAPEIGL